MTATSQPRTAKVSRLALAAKATLNRHAVFVAGVLVLFLMAIGLFAPFLPLQSPTLQGEQALVPPSAQHWLGTDEFGRDLFSRVIFGIRQNALVGVVAVPLGAVIGVVLGLVSGLNRVFDTVLQRMLDVSLAFSTLIMGIVVAAIVGTGSEAVIITVTLVNIPLFGRLTRSAVRSQLVRDYVTAARVTGAGPIRVLVRHVLPNAVDALVVQTALSLSIAVFIEGAMSFVGIGVRPPEPSLGSLLRSSTSFLTVSPLYAIAPMVLLTALVLCFNIIGDGLNRRLLRR
jgi:peptide/nickel transport system permease protein